MSSSRQAGRYQEMEVRTATPTELVVLLYDATLSSLQESLKHIRAHDISNRVRCLNKVSAILTELQANLNFELGGEIAQSLDRLYGYMKERVFQANLKQDQEPIREVARLMDVLREGWMDVAQTEAGRKIRGSDEEKPAPETVGVTDIGATGPSSNPANLNITA